MELFAFRRRALNELQTTFREEAEVIEKAFSLIDECITELSKEFHTSTIARAASLATAKGTLLAQGCYTLTLDGLAQESGALLRPLIEVAEVLTYFQLDDRAEHEFKEGRLPSAGKIAQRIDRKVQHLRDYLNEDASHFSFSFDSLRHVVTPGDPVALNIHPRFHAHSFRENLKSLFTFLSLVLSAAVGCLAKTRHLSLEREPLATDVAKSIRKGCLLFQISIWSGHDDT